MSPGQDTGVRGWGVLRIWGNLGQPPSTSYSAHWDTSEGFPHKGTGKGQMKWVLKDWAQRGSKWADRAALSLTPSTASGTPEEPSFLGGRPL